MTLSYGDGPFRLYVPYGTVPVNVLLERYRQESLEREQLTHATNIFE
jgi:hypothetical protein